MNSRSLLGVPRSVARHRSLLWELTKREVLGRYRGSNLGLLWSLLAPLLMLTVYIVAFGSIMRSRWPGTDDSTATFALIIFPGLIVHGFFAECLVRASGLVVANANYVKKIVFPLEILPWPMMLSALFHVVANLAVFVAFQLAVHGQVPWTICFLPVVILPFVLMMAGITWLVAALAVYFRDIGQLMPPLATAALFLSSAIVPVNAVPQQFQILFRLNPLTFVIDQVRAVALWGAVPEWSGLATYGALSLVVMVGGLLAFKSMRAGFADVI